MGELSAVALVLQDRVKDGRPVQLLHEALGGEGVACAGRGEVSFRRRLGAVLRAPGSEPPAHLRTGEGGLSEGGERMEGLFWEEGAGNRATGALAHLLSSHELSFAQAETVPDWPTSRASYKDERRDVSNLSFNRGRH